MQLWLRYYATDKERDKHATEWPTDATPPKEKRDARHFGLSIHTDKACKPAPVELGPLASYEHRNSKADRPGPTPYGTSWPVLGTGARGDRFDAARS